MNKLTPIIVMAALCAPLNSHADIADAVANAGVVLGTEATQKTDSQSQVVATNPIVTTPSTNVDSDPTRADVAASSTIAVGPLAIKRQEYKALVARQNQLNETYKPRMAPPQGVDLQSALADLKSKLESRPDASTVVVEPADLDMEVADVTGPAELIPEPPVALDPVTEADQKNSEGSSSLASLLERLRNAPEKALNQH